MIAKFSEALSLLARHLGLFAAIILTVWLPGNLVLNYLAYNADGGGDLNFVKLAMWIEGIFGPIYIGAMMHALFEIKSGRTVTYRQAMAVGFRKWGALFAARFVAQLLIGLGLIAFLIPGLMLAVRYALLDAAVVIDGEGVSGSRARSTQLTAGRRWQILGAAVLFCFVFTVFSAALYLPLAFFESLDVMPVELALDCIGDVAFAVLQIALFLYYWEATENERSTEESPAPEDDDAAPAWDAAAAQEAAGADDNPFRSPMS
ncbi:MAG TPA: hypothetical protein VMV10_03305 [Pirellulales bacterium]|nr:hypothetical protein [Pirellulales bacterium]